jgi:hypothetical protein
MLISQIIYCPNCGSSAREHPTWANLRNQEQMSHTNIYKNNSLVGLGELPVDYRSCDFTSC